MILLLVIPWTLCLVAALPYSGLAEEPSPLPLPDSPEHARPFLMPPGERQRIKQLVERQDWARQQYEQLRRKAGRGDGFSAAFLYALDRDESLLPAARKWLLSGYGPESYWVKKYRQRMADPDYFKLGQQHLSDVYYVIDTPRIIAFDWVHDGLQPEDRRTIRDGLLLNARFRMRAMDRWTQTPNLVFKPTFVVALTGLVTRDKECLEWGFRRTKPWGAHIGGYFAVLNHMLRDGGPWHEAPIYPIAHRDLILTARMSRFLTLADGQDWFRRELPRGGSPQGLMDYYLDTAYPIERRGDIRRIRVATYGDGATNSNGDLFLVHTAPARDKKNLLVHEPLAAAYNVSGDPAYAAFLAMLPDYQPDLWQQRPLPSKASNEPAFPPAPSRVWPDFGLAMLRSDESPEYWISGRALAVFHIMTQGYGHDHRDKFSILLHGAGHLFYPDYNALQYENMAIGWTRNSVSHNTMLVDEQDTRNADPSEIRHEFTPEVKFLATSASGVFEGVDQTRALLLAPEYLLDVFHARSRIPHTYDYLLHSFGEAHPVQPDAYQPTDVMKRRFYLVDDHRGMNTSDDWSLDFVIQKEPAARLRLTMAGEPRTHVTIGRWGERLARLVEERSKGKGQPLDRLSMLAVRRADARQTAFVATHEPVPEDRSPQVGRVVKLAERPEGVLVRVDGRDFTDYAAVRYGASGERADQAESDRSRALHFLMDDGRFASIDNYGYLRVWRDGTILARGGWLGFRLPLDRRARQWTLNGKTLPAQWTEGDLCHGAPPAPADIEQASESFAAGLPECPFPVTLADDAPPRMFGRQRHPVALRIRNTLSRPVSGHVHFTLPTGFAMEPSQTDFGPLAPGEARELSLSLATRDPAPGRHTLTYQVAYGVGDDEPRMTAAQPLVVFVGPTLENEYANGQARYVVRTPKLTARFEMFQGLCTFLADPDGAVRLNGTPLFTLANGENLLLHPGTEHAFTWPREAPADLVAHAYDKCRWQAFFFGGRIAFRMDQGWTQFETADFEVPGRWISPAGKPRWQRIVALDATAKEREARPGVVERVVAAELAFPDGQWSLAVQFAPPQTVTFQDAGMKFSIGALTRDNWQIGFCRPGQLDAWRGK